MSGNQRIHHAYGFPALSNVARTAPGWRDPWYEAVGYQAINVIGSTLRLAAMASRPWIGSMRRMRRLAAFPVAAVQDGFVRAFVKSAHLCPSVNRIRIAAVDPGVVLDRLALRAVAHKSNGPNGL